MTFDHYTGLVWDQLPGITSAQRERFLSFIYHAWDSDVPVDVTVARINYQLTRSEPCRST